jgi:HPt (histidine-containing phosphotransfer) domain-containing protein
VVALTADALPATRAACLAADMDDCLAKPLDAARLAGLIGRFLPGAAALRRRPAPPEEAAEAAAVPLPAFQPDLFDTSRLVDSFGGFTPAARAFLAEFAANLPDQFEALEMAFGAADFGGAHEQAQALVSAARSVGATTIGDAATAVQAALEQGDVDLGQERLSAVAEAVQAFRAATEGVI